MSSCLAESTTKFIQEVETSSRNIASATVKLEREWEMLQSSSENRDSEDSCSAKGESSSSHNPVDLVRRVQALEVGLQQVQSRSQQVDRRKRQVVPELHNLLADNQRLLQRIQMHTAATNDDFLPAPPSVVAERARLLEVMKKNASALKKHERQQHDKDTQQQPQSHTIQPSSAPMPSPKK